eukprot:768131-Rhodomonas_salina.4
MHCTALPPTPPLNAPAGQVKADASCLRTRCTRRPVLTANTGGPGYDYHSHSNHHREPVVTPPVSSGSLHGSHNAKGHAGSPPSRSDAACNTDPVPDAAREEGDGRGRSMLGGGGGGGGG